MGGTEPVLRIDVLLRALIKMRWHCENHPQSNGSRHPGRTAQCRDERERGRQGIWTGSLSIAIRNTARNLHTRQRLDFSRSPWDGCPDNQQFTDLSLSLVILHFVVRDRSPRNNDRVDRFRKSSCRRGVPATGRALSIFRRPGAFFLNRVAESDRAF
jgi:hypothetical protein